MKKILYIIIIILLYNICYAQSYTLKNSSIGITIDVKADNLTQISSIKDNSTGVEYIKNVPFASSLWEFSVKKNRDYASKEITLNSSDAESVKVQKSKNKLVLTYNNVSNDQISDKFNVVATVELVRNNSYWTINVLNVKNSQDEFSSTPLAPLYNLRGESEHYGIWEVFYPYVDGLDCENGDNFFMPWHGDVFVTEFDNEKGFQAPFSDDPNVYTKDFEWQTPVMVQYTSLTKGNSTLYISPEDVKVSQKFMRFHWNEPNNMCVNVKNQPANMGVAGYDFVSKNKLNISVMKGDWFTAAKKYRKWGIDNKYAPYAKGKLEDRTDVPQWWKDLCIMTNGWVRSDSVVKTLLRTKEEFKDIPLLYQVYGLPDYTYDTHYPTFTPFDKEGFENLKKLKDAGLIIIPYTNGHLGDKAYNESIKANPDNYLAKKFDGSFTYEPWAKDAGADDNVVCIGSDYYDLYLNEVKKMFQMFPFDGWYVDQVGGTIVEPCFEESHNHPVGGGTYLKEGYDSLFKEIRKIGKEATGNDIIITTECGGDCLDFDGWLKCNENGFKSEKNKVRSVLFSGYTQSYGSQSLSYKPYEFDAWECLSPVNLFATTLTHGYIMGWEGFEKEVFWTRDNLANYLRGAVYARNEVKEYFNFGEMVRDVKIISEIPKKHVYWTHFTCEQEVDADTIKTCSYFYKGKAMVCITNADVVATPVEWESCAGDLYLKNKSTYTISQVYPEKKVISKNVKNIGGKFVINPLETVIFIVE